MSDPGSAGGCTPRHASGKKSTTCGSACLPCERNAHARDAVSTTRHTHPSVPPVPSSWSSTLRMTVKSLRFAVKHAPCSATGLRVLAGMSMPTMLLPNGIARCSTRISPHVTADWVWPSHFTPTLRGFAKRWPATFFSKPAHEYPEFLDHIRTERVVLYLHGGAYLCCTKGTHRGLVYGIAKRADAFLLNLDYRRIPHTDLDGVVDDALQGYRFLLNLGVPASNIVLCGDSAGGGLCCLLMLRLRSLGKDPLPCAAALISPWVDLDNTRRRDVQPHALKYDYVNEKFRVWGYAVDTVVGERARNDPLCSPLYADLSNLPPILVQAGEHEVLRSQIEELVDKITLASGAALMDVVPDMVHVPPLFASLCPKADAGFDRLAKFIREPISSSAGTTTSFTIQDVPRVSGMDDDTFSVIVDSLDTQPDILAAEAVHVTHGSSTGSSEHSGHVEGRISTVASMVPGPASEETVAYSARDTISHPEHAHAA